MRGTRQQTAPPTRGLARKIALGPGGENTAQDDRRSQEDQQQAEDQPQGSAHADCSDASAPPASDPFPQGFHDRQTYSAFAQTAKGDIPRVIHAVENPPQLIGLDTFALVR